MTAIGLSRRPFLALAGAAALAPTRGRAAPIGQALDLSRLKESFSTDFADLTKPIFRTEGGPFSTRFEAFSGARTLVPNKEQELYVDRFFIPSPTGPTSNGNNDSPDPNGIPAGLDPFRVQDGVLTITAMPTPRDLLKTVGRPYVSGLLSTDRSFSQRYGYFEMRAQLPGGQGIWPAFWLFGTTEKYRLEIDVLEALGHERDRIYQSAQPNSTRGQGSHLPLKPGFDYTEAMHDYGMLWTPDALSFYVDRKMTAAIDGAPFRDEVPVYMIANLAVGGSWGGNPDASTHFPAAMRIEHIKAYRLA